MMDQEKMRMIIRELIREEIAGIWSIDRSEIIENIYYLQDGALILKPEHFDMTGWPPGEAEQHTPILCDCFDRGGTFYGACERSTLVGVAVLDSKFIGQRQDQLQLKFLHVSRGYRKQGLGRTLFEKAVERARQLGAKQLYISATPSENTVNFYRNLGCKVTSEIDPELFELEPEDIHFEYTLRP